MKKILSVSDSYEGTHLDVKRAVTTIKAFEMDPFIAVSEFIRTDGTSDPIDIKATLDYCFEDCTPDAVFIGFIREARHAAIVSSVIESHSPSIIVSDPSIISDKGEVWMTEDTYNVISTSIFDMSTHIIINHLEAELLSGFECSDRMDFERAARKLHNCFHAAVYIKGCSKTSCKGLFCDDTDITWVDDDRASARPELSLGNALNCELALGTKGLKALTNALFFTVNGRRVSESIPVPQVAPSLISPAKSLRDIARSIDTQPQPSVQPKSAKTSIIDPVTEGTKGTVSELKAPEKAPARSVGDSLSELAEIRKRLEALKKSSGSS